MLQIISIIKNSNEFNQLIQTCINYYHSAKAYNKTQERTKIVPTANAEEKELLLSSLDEGTNRTKLPPPTAADAHKEGTNLNDTNAPIMNVLGVPYNNIETIERLHFELFKMMQKDRNNLIITCDHPSTPERSLSHVSLP